MDEDCNKRGGRVIGDLGELSCAEVEIVKCLRRAGWDAAWISPFKCGERRWGWYRRRSTALPDPVRDIERQLGLADAGRPDVTAWTGQRVLYLESKGPGDALKPKQVHWISAVSLAAIPGVEIGLVEWTSCTSS
jgi:hypothetical protein